jgi:hypothetical protein
VEILMASAPVIPSANPTAPNANQALARTNQAQLNFMNATQQYWSQQVTTQEAAQAQVNQAASAFMSGNIPFGYSPALDQLLQANVMQTGSQGISNAINALQLQLKQQSGGASTAPSGASAALEAQVEATGQQGIAQGLQAEKIAGYQQGAANLKAGMEGELGVAESANPNAAANASTGVSQAAASSAEQMFQEQQATGPLAVAGKIIGDVSEGIGDVVGIGDIGSMFQNYGPSQSSVYSQGIPVMQSAAPTMSAAFNTPTVAPPPPNI